MLRAYLHNRKLKNAAIRMVFQYWVTYVDGSCGTKFVQKCFLAYSIVDTLVSTIGLTPKQNGRRHISLLILCLE